MKKQLFISFFVVLFLTSAGIIFLFAQESETRGAPGVSESANTPLTTESQETPAAKESEVQWLWGEIVSVDTLTKQMIVKYLDYETDTEKEISININDKTNFENAKSLDEIKAHDTVSVDYITTSEGKNIAKNIGVEKNEGMQTLPEENKEEPKATPGLE